MTELNFNVNQTLAAIDEALVDGQESKPRPYLGMSGIGHPCAKKVWYDFRWTTTRRMKASSIRAIQDGFAGEDVMAERLRKVKGVKLMTVDPNTGRQFGFVGAGGHFKGHLDGAIIGILEAPKTWHVWEHKQVNETKFNKLKKLVLELGEKNALEKWDETYFAQAQCYMGYSEMTRHFLTVCSPGGRDYTSVRTEFSSSVFKSIVDKAQWIIAQATPPDGISTDASWYECKWCDHKDVCHGTAAPVPTCRSCTHSTPERDGRWTCAVNKVDLSVQEQTEACTSHRIIPIMLKNWAEPVDANQDENWVQYKLLTSGFEFKNGEPTEGFSSQELYALKEKSMLECQKLLELRTQFDGRLVA